MYNMISYLYLYIYIIYDIYIKTYFTTEHLFFPRNIYGTVTGETQH